MNSVVHIPPPAFQLHFARGFRFVGHLVVIIFRILFVDIVQWGAVYLIIIPGFAVTLFLLVRDEWVRGRKQSREPRTLSSYFNCLFYFPLPPLHIIAAIIPSLDLVAHLGFR